MTSRSSLGIDAPLGKTSSISSRARLAAAAAAAAPRFGSALVVFTAPLISVLILSTSAFDSAMSSSAFTPGTSASESPLSSAGGVIIFDFAPREGVARVTGAGDFVRERRLREGLGEAVAAMEAASEARVAREAVFFSPLLGDAFRRLLGADELAGCSGLPIIWLSGPPVSSIRLAVSGSGEAFDNPSTVSEEHIVNILLMIRRV